MASRAHQAEVAHSLAPPQDPIFFLLLHFVASTPNRHPLQVCPPLKVQDFRFIIDLISDPKDQDYLLFTLVPVLNDLDLESQVVGLDPRLSFQEFPLIDHCSPLVHFDSPLIDLDYPLVEGFQPADQYFHFARLLYSRLHLCCFQVATSFTRFATLH